MFHAGTQIDATFSRLPCDWISVTALDVSGRIQTTIDHDLSRQRLDLRGKALSIAEQHKVGAIDDHLPEHLHPAKPELPAGYCGSCFGAAATEGQCCNTCEEVRNAYRLKGWVMPEYEVVEQCKREGFIDSILAVVRT
jgi:endoplasmic reticulum-Golgi intermediate compartment protein 3